MDLLKHLLNRVDEDQPDKFGNDKLDVVDYQSIKTGDLLVFVDDAVERVIGKVVFIGGPYEALPFKMPLFSAYQDSVPLSDDNAHFEYVKRRYIIAKVRPWRTGHPNKNDKQKLVYCILTPHENFFKLKKGVTVDI